MKKRPADLLWMIVFGQYWFIYNRLYKCALYIYLLYLPITILSFLSAVVFSSMYDSSSWHIFLFIILSCKATDIIVALLYYFNGKNPARKLDGGQEFEDKDLITPLIIFVLRFFNIDGYNFVTSVLSALIIFYKHNKQKKICYQRRKDIKHQKTEFN